jgi:hypothetical protein
MNHTQTTSPGDQSRRNSMNASKDYTELPQKGFDITTENPSFEIIQTDMLSDGIPNAELKTSVKAITRRIKKRKSFCRRCRYHTLEYSITWETYLMFLFEGAISVNECRCEYFISMTNKAFRNQEAAV